jgi:hypothetical protein
MTNKKGNIPHLPKKKSKKDKKKEWKSNTVVRSSSGEPI